MTWGSAGIKWDLVSLELTDPACRENMVNTGRDCHFQSPCPSEAFLPKKGLCESVLPRPRWLGVYPIGLSGCSRAPGGQQGGPSAPPTQQLRSWVGRENTAGFLLPFLRAQLQKLHSQILRKPQAQPPSSLEAAPRPCRTGNKCPCPSRLPLRRLRRAPATSPSQRGEDALALS